MRFESPLALLFLVFAPLFLEPLLRDRVFRIRKRRVTGTIQFASPVALSTLPVGPRVRFRSTLLSILQIGAYILLVIALARPQLGRSFRETEASGRDIMLALDLSGSMQAMDFFIDQKRVTRLAALKLVVKQFISARAGDRMGLVVFGENAFTQCPLTLDHGVLIEFIDAMEVGMAGQSTAIGDGLAISLKRIRDIPGKSKVIVLVTDGKSNAGNISPEQATQIAKDLGVTVHVVGIGGPEPAPFPMKSVFGTTQLVKRELEYDAKTLKQIAETTGGQYFNAKDLSGLEQVYAAINTLEERQEKAAEYTEYSERFLPFAGAALALLLTFELLGSTVLLKVP